MEPTGATWMFISAARSCTPQTILAMRHDWAALTIALRMVHFAELTGHVPVYPRYRSKGSGVTPDPGTESENSGLRARHDTSEPAQGRHPPFKHGMCVKLRIITPINAPWTVRLSTSNTAVHCSAVTGRRRICHWYRFNAVSSVFAQGSGCTCIARPASTPGVCLLLHTCSTAVGCWRWEVFRARHDLIACELHARPEATGCLRGTCMRLW